MRALTDVTGETLRLWREAKGWDVPRMARELRKVAKDSGEDVAAHHGLVKMIPQWERGGRVPRERVQAAVPEDLHGHARRPVAGHGVRHGCRAAAHERSAPAQPACPATDDIRALEGAALAKPRETITPAEIRALAAEAIAHLHEVADKLAELSALLGDDEAGEDKP